MKALELLSELTIIISTARLFYENKANFEFTKAYEERIYKAIAELETLQQELKQGQDNYDKLWNMYSELKRENRVLQEYINETKDCMYCKEAKAIKIWDERSIR